MDKITDEPTSQPEDQPVDTTHAAVEPQVEGEVNKMDTQEQSEVTGGSEQNGSIVSQTVRQSAEVKVNNEENTDTTDSVTDPKRDIRSSELIPSTPPAKHRTLSPLVLSSHDVSGSSSPPAQLKTVSKDSSRPSSAKNFSRSGQPSPTMFSSSPAPLNISRTSSTEPPLSPFLIPRNPFLSLVGKMPKFQWDVVHFSLLENLFKSLHAIVSKWTR